MVGEADRDPTVGRTARALLSNASRDIITLQVRHTIELPACCTVRRAAC